MTVIPTKSYKLVAVESILLVSGLKIRLKRKIRRIATMPLSFKWVVKPTVGKEFFYPSEKRTHKEKMDLNKFESHRGPIGF